MILTKFQQTSSDVITPALFGGNLLFRYDLVSGENANYSQIADSLGVSSLRYPGGTMTEINFDVTHPDNAPIGVKGEAPYVGVSEFLQFAQESHRAVNMVLPTKGMYAGSADPYSDKTREIQTDFAAKVLNYVRLLLTHGDSSPEALPDTNIDTIEIGNEYWGGGKMTAAEYGKVVNYLVPAIQALFDELIAPGLDRPKILVQMGCPVDDQFKSGLYGDLDFNTRLIKSNINIIDQITDPLAIAGIDGLVRHYYYSSSAQYLQQNTWTMSSLDSTFDIWKSAGYGDRDYYVTEWNVALENTSQMGLRGASILIAQFSYMVDLGVDAAFAWPVQGYSTGLYSSSGGSPQLTPIGAAFELLSESLIGTHSLGLGVENGPINVETFGSDHKIVLFVSSRSEHHESADVDISGLFERFSSISATKLGVAAGISTVDPFATAILSDISSAALIKSGHLYLDLDPYEVVRITVNLPVSLELNGTANSDTLRGDKADDKIAGFAGDDTLMGDMGADRIAAGYGADVVFAGNGNDTIFGGFGADRLTGGIGADLVYGGFGSDTILAVSGFDTLFGGDGADRLGGGSGNAALFGGSGVDSIFGFNGNDTITGGRGDDKLWGGAGADTFRFVRGDGNDSVMDLQSDDHLIFLGFSGTTVGRLIELYVHDSDVGLVLDLPGDDLLTFYGIHDAATLASIASLG